MTIVCCDTEKGLLLHGYELNLLSESERDIFETHLLECPYCFEQVKEFAPRGTLLSSDPEIIKSLQDNQDENISITERIRQYLWPNKTPIIFKPALLFIVIVLLVYPAYLGMFDIEQGNVRSTQEIGLVLNRSSDTKNVFYLDKNIETVLSFLNPSDSKSELSIKLMYADTQTLFENKNFTGIDSFGVGHLLIPQPLIQDGKYSLIVSSNDTTYQFYFIIETSK